MVIGFAVSGNGGVGVAGVATLSFAATPNVSALIYPSCTGSGGATLTNLCCW